MKSVKILFCIFVLSMAAIVTHLSVGADNTAKITIDSEVFSFVKPPVVVNDTVLAPAGELADRLGLSSKWDGASRQVHIFDNKGMDLYFTIDTTIYRKNRMIASVSEAPIIINEIAYVPAADVAKAFGYKAFYDKATLTLAIRDPKKVTETSTQTTTASSVATTVSTTATQATTTVQHSLNNSLIPGVGKSIFDKVYKDLGIAAGSYSIGSAESNMRLNTLNINKITKNWELLAKTDEEKKFVSACTALYKKLASNIVTEDKWYNKNSSTKGVREKMVRFKERTIEKVYTFTACASIDDINKLSNALGAIKH